MIAVKNTELELLFALRHPHAAEQALAVISSFVAAPQSEEKLICDNKIFLDTSDAIFARLNMSIACWARPGAAAQLIVKKPRATAWGNMAREETIIKSDLDCFEPLSLLDEARGIFQVDLQPRVQVQQKRHKYTLRTYSARPLQVSVDEVVFIGNGAQSTKNFLEIEINVPASDDDFSLEMNLLSELRRELEKAVGLRSLFPSKYIYWDNTREKTALVS